MKAKDIGEMSDLEIDKRIEELAGMRGKYYFEQDSEGKRDVSRANKMRKEVARLKTVKRAREMERE